MDDVLKFVRTTGVLATCAIGALVAWASLAVGRADSRALPLGRRTFAAAALVPALPPVLTAPAVPAERQFVAMVADDIDADGDLDVIANDGALNLFVWINDGTGRLTRREAKRQGGVGREPAGPGFAGDPDGPDTILVSVSPFAEPVSPFSLVLARKSRPRPDGAAFPLAAVFLSDRPSRAPPAFAFLS